MMKRRALIKALPAMGIGAISLPAMAESKTPEERFQYHMAEMLSALADMPWPEGSRWFLSSAGRAGSGKLLELSRYDRVPDPEIPRLIIERRHEIIGV